MGRNLNLLLKKAEKIERILFGPITQKGTLSEALIFLNIFRSDYIFWPFQPFDPISFGQKRQYPKESVLCTRKSFFSVSRPSSKGL
jgi:hypothetical protein